MTSPIDDHDDLTVDEVKARVSAAELSADQLQQVLDYERATADRVTLTRWLDRRVANAREAEAADDVATVTVTSYTGGYTAGVWFDHPLQHKEVERTTRVERAIKAGDLVTVGEHE